VPVQECEPVVVQSDSLPDPVTDQEAAVEDGDPGFDPGVEVAVDVDLDGRVAGVGECLVGVAR